MFLGSVCHCCSQWDKDRTVAGIKKKWTDFDLQEGKKEYVHNHNSLLLISHTFSWWFLSLIAKFTTGLDSVCPIMQFCINEMKILPSWKGVTQTLFFRLSSLSVVVCTSRAESMRTHSMSYAIYQETDWSELRGELMWFDLCFLGSVLILSAAPPVFNISADVIASLI